MIRRLIAYLYLGNYDPTIVPHLATFSEIKQQVSTAPLAQAYHSRYRNSSVFGSTDYCACLAPNTLDTQQPVQDLAADPVPSDYRPVDKPTDAVEVADPLTIHVTMHALADKYQVEGLGQVARSKFKACLRHHTKSADFLNAVQIAYSATPDTNRGLRDAVLEAFLVHFQVNIADMPGIEAKLDTIDELSFQLIQSWPVKTQPMRSGHGTFGGFGST